MRRNIARDTLLLTVIQMLLDGLALLLNVFMTERLGASSVGILTLTASFFNLASVIASGNAFLCASRFISEELGKKPADPTRILLYCLGVSLTLSVLTAALIAGFAPFCSVRFLKSPGLAKPIRILALSLPLLTVCACMRGYFNACCAVKICAASDAIGFLVRCGLTAAAVYWLAPSDSRSLCLMMVLCTCAGSMATLLYLLARFRKLRVPATGKASISVRTYLKLAVPVMFGSMLTSFLSAANDALVPLTLQQSGNSAEQALSQFGIYEAIVIPALFFPSTVLCSLSGILVTETARESAAGNCVRITALTEKTLRQTLVFAVFTAGIFLMFGKELGELLGGGAFAGRMLALLAPVVPFIYLEIVLESILKGIGAQAFSSLNYLAEYVIRISVVLIFVPVMGFYGIVLSYYASNICGNISRLVMALRRTGMRPKFRQLLGIPVFSFLLSSQLCALLFTLLHIQAGAGIVQMGIFVVLCAGLYLFLQRKIFGLAKPSVPGKAGYLPKLPGRI